MDKKTKQHPSYGMLGFSRINCSGGVALFGSDLTHTTFIEMSLHHAEVDRKLSHNWYHATDKIASVYMSQNQFSELITSMNMGEGIPVTLRMTEKDGRIEQDTCESVKALHETEFRQQVKDVSEGAAKLLADAHALLKGSGTVKKTDREAILGQIEKVVREIQSNMPYMEKCFKQSMDKVVTDAKGSIEAFYQHRVIETGLKALAEESDQPELIEDQQSE